MSSAGTLGMPWGAASGGISQPWSEPLSQLPRGEEPPLDFLSGQTQRSFSLSTPELPGYFLSVSMSASRVTAKCFPTLPLPLLPFQHRGKYCAHTFHEYSLNDWMFVRGDQLPSCTLRVCCCYSISSLAAFLSLLSLFLLGIQHIRPYAHVGGFCFLQIICISSSWTCWQLPGGMLAALLNWHDFSSRLPTC